MKKWFYIIVLIVFAACQKGIEPFTDSGTTTGDSGLNNIAGTWKFISLSSNTQINNEYTDMDSLFKTIIFSNYITANNNGSVTFNADGLYTTSNIGYSVDTTANTYDYENGVLQDSSFQPFHFSIDSFSSAGTYALTGTDSISFSKPLIPTSVATSAQPEPSAGKINLSGNTLTLTETFYQDTTLEIADFPTHSINSGKFTMIFKKQ